MKIFFENINLGLRGGGKKRPSTGRALVGDLAVRGRGLHGPRVHLESRRGRSAETVWAVSRRRRARGLRESPGEPSRGGFFTRLVSKTRHGHHRVPHGRAFATKQHAQGRVRGDHATGAVRPVQTNASRFFFSGGAGGAPRGGRARERHRPCLWWLPSAQPSQQKANKNVNVDRPRGHEHPDPVADLSNLGYDRGPQRQLGATIRTCPPLLGVPMALHFNASTSLAARHVTPKRHPQSGCRTCVDTRSTRALSLATCMWHQGR